MEVGEYDSEMKDGKFKLIIEKKGLYDPNHPAVILCLYIYQMENFAYAELNRSCRYKDESKLPTLGPWACALNEIIGAAQQHRPLSCLYDCNKRNDLWRGGGITQDQINEYTQMVGKTSLIFEDGHFITLHGFTSCSLDKSLASTFAWENKSTGHSKVIFHIKFDEIVGAYYLDAGAYDYENEVLLTDGVGLWVESVQAINDKQGKLMHTLITLKS